MVASSLDKPTARSDIRLADWLTVERAAYAGIAVLALGCGDGLGRVPLGPAEAVQAFPAWAAAAGLPYDGSTALTGALIGVSPLLFGLQWLLFALFGVGDAIARSGRPWPAGWRRCCSTARDRLTGGALIGGLLGRLRRRRVHRPLGLCESLVAPLAMALLAALNVWARQTPASDETGATSKGAPLRWAAVALGLL